MPPLPRPLRSLQERTNRELALRGLSHGVLVTAICALMMALAIYHGDTLQRNLWGGLILSTVVFVIVNKTCPPRVSIPFGLVSGVIGLLATQVILPADPTGFISIMPGLLAMLTTAFTFRQGLVLLALLLGLRACIPLVGLPLGMPSVVPQWQMVAVILAPFLIGSVWSTRRQMRFNDLALRTARATELALADSSDILERQQGSLEQTTALLTEETAQLSAEVSRLETLLGELEQRRGEERDLMYAIEQDLREPLRHIVSFSQLITRRVAKMPEATRVQELLTFAVDGGHRMTVMLGELLRYAKHEHDEDTQEEVDLARVAEEVRQDLADLIDRSGARVVIDELPSVMGYPTQLRQLFQNLIGNALKFSRPGVPPLVRVYTLGSAGQLVIAFEDNGIGIAPEQITKVFGLFNRAHDPSAYEGSGVGLALCRRIAILHECKLTVESTPGEGSRFCLAWPAPGSPSETLSTAAAAKTSALATSPVRVAVPLTPEVVGA